MADLVFVGDQQGWAVGGRGLILHTSDGGQTWAVQKSGVTRNIMSVAFARRAARLRRLHGQRLLLRPPTAGPPGSASGAYGRTTTRSAALAVGVDGRIWAALGGREWSGYVRPPGVDRQRRPHVAVPGREQEPAPSGTSSRGARIYAVGPTEELEQRSDVTQVLVSDDAGATWQAHLTGTASLGGDRRQRRGDAVRRRRHHGHEHRRRSHLVRGSTSRASQHRWHRPGRALRRAGP